jgi:hypothetical protein
MVCYLTDNPMFHNFGVIYACSNIEVVASAQYWIDEKNKAASGFQIFSRCRLRTLSRR